MARVRADMNDVNMHYFLRPDHPDAARIWSIVIYSQPSTATI